MAGNKVSIDKELLTVENSDMLKDARTPAAKDLLKISPFFVRSEINLQGLARNPALDKKITAAVQKRADGYEKELVGQLKKLVDELIELRKKDEKSSDDKLGDSAETKVRKVSDALDDALVEFGHDMRKALKNIVKLTSSMKSISRGQFRGLKLMHEFSGGSNRELAEAYGETAQDLASVAKKLIVAAVDEKKLRAAASQGLEQALKETRQWEKDAQDSSGSGDRQNKLVLKTARNLQSLLDELNAHLDTFHKLLTSTANGANKRLTQFKKDAPDKEKKALQTVIKELQLLIKEAAARQEASGQLATNYRRLSAAATAPALADWRKRLEHDLRAVAAWKDLPVRHLNKVISELNQLAKKLA